MGDELSLLLEIFNKIKKAGGQATLCVATGGGKTKEKLETTTTPLLLQLGQLQLQVGGVNVAAVRKQGLAATSVQLHTRLPWQRQQPPVLH